MPTIAKKRLEPRRKPRQARSQATVEVILAAAARVFARAGYAATTTNHVAAKAGVSIGSLYEYFPSKDAILVALTERHVDEAERELGRVLAALGAARPPLDEAITRLVRTMVELHARDPGLHRVLFEEAPLPAKLRERVALLETGMAAALARLLGGHGFDREEARTAAAMAVQVAESLTHRLVLHDVGRSGAGWREAAEPHVREISLLLLGYLERKRAGAAVRA
ncbi:TetR/AcrR family transcriptional regulator [Candidatus Binatia bacterium]|nr:TetR/AcrR family transcriptional regulator [Candidatus Binatia bacterium]